jgi:hypothetical protein
MAADPGSDGMDVSVSDFTFGEDIDGYIVSAR